MELALRSSSRRRLHWILILGGRDASIHRRAVVAATNRRHVSFGSRTTRHRHVGCDTVVFVVAVLIFVSAAW
jgi:hypothetical protein